METSQKILIVDDERLNINVLADLLKPYYKIMAAISGRQALKAARSDNQPDLILLDVMMPEMDGYEVCRQLKADKKTRDIPVIFVTAMGEVTDETKGLEIGAVDYITKPIASPVVLARVKNHLELKNARKQLAEFSDKLARYVSPQISNSIYDGSRDVSLETRRCKMTVFFSDIAGFTSLSEKLEPEDLMFVLNSYLSKMARIVKKHGGILDKFIGDAVLVFFGDLESKGLAEDALACVEMSIDMQKAVNQLADEYINNGIQRPLAVRMGISTGYCNVGNFGSEERMDYTIIGRHVNQAARLQAAADPGQILISKETWALVNSRVNCIPKEPVIAKGFSDPIEAYQVEG